MMYPFDNHPPTPPPDEPNDPEYLKAQALFDAGELLMREDSEEAHRNALSKFSEALELFKSVGGPFDRGWCLLDSAIVHRQLGELDLAKAQMEMAAEAFDRSDRMNLARVSYESGHIELVRGNFFEALHYYEEALPIFESTSFSECECADVHTYIADAFSELGYWVQAIEHYSRAAAVLRRFERLEDLCDILEELATCYGELGMGDRAEECRREAEQLKDAW